VLPIRKNVPYDAAGEETKEIGERRPLARLHAVTAHKAALVLSTVPSSAELSIPDSAFALHSRSMLGLDPAEHMPPYCKACGERSADLQVDPWHALSCPALLPLLTKRRHDRVVSVLARHLRELDCPTHIEPRRLRSEIADGVRSEDRPDLDVHLPSQRSLLDVSIRNPLAESNLSTAIKGPLAVARSAARGKARKYASLAEGLGAAFVPFVFETLGGMVKEASKFIKQLLKDTKELRSSLDLGDLVYSLRRAPSIAVVRGNAECVLACLAKSRD